jgi:hypothetical protein
MTEVFIVARNETDLYEYLKQHFAGNQDVEVILGWRSGERYRRDGVMRAEWRTGGRRERSVERDLTALGFGVVMSRSPRRERT